MISRRNFSTLMLTGAAAAMLPAAARGQTAVKARNVVLVHGAWADGSSWGEVIPRLQAAGLNVTAVQNPLTSLADSVAATRRALALQDGPTVLAAHSWGGTVISEAGTDAKVTALVYVAARAPDADEDFVALSAKFPTMPVRAGVQEHDGFTTISEEAFLKYFRQRCRARKGGSPLCRAGARRRVAVRRANHGGRLARQTELVCGIKRRSDDSARPGAISGKAHERDHRGAGGRSPVPGLPSASDRQPDPGCRRPGRLALIQLPGCVTRGLTRASIEKSSP
jgi:pimeloyl-ACP methyl ester carboxylesterase